jgi:hypothetical protein
MAGREGVNERVTKGTASWRKGARSRPHSRTGLPDGSALTRIAFA